MQLIKGGFSYRLKKELRYLGEVWQRKKRQGLKPANDCMEWHD